MWLYCNAIEVQWLICNWICCSFALSEVAQKCSLVAKGLASGGLNCFRVLYIYDSHKFDWFDNFPILCEFILFANYLFPVLSSVFPLHVLQHCHWIQFMVIPYSIIYIVKHIDLINCKHLVIAIELLDWYHYHLDWFVEIKYDLDWIIYEEMSYCYCALGWCYC